MGWFRKKPSTDASSVEEVAAETESVPGTVLALLAPATVDIVLFPGSGQADGGIRVTVPLEKVALDARVPNTKLEIVVHRRTRAIVEVKRQPAGTQFRNGRFVVSDADAE